MIGKSYNRILLGIVFLIFFALLFLSSAELQGEFGRAVDFFGGYFKENFLIGGFLFVGISAVSVLLSPFSSVPLVPAAMQAWGNFIPFILLLTGWIIGGIAAYYAGSCSREKIFRRFFSFEKIKYYQKRIPAKSQFWLVLLFRLAIPSEIAGYTLGIIRYHFGKYLLATFLAELPFSFFVIYSSGALVSGRIWLFIGLLILAALLLGIFSYFLRQKIKV